MLGHLRIGATTFNRGLGEKQRRARKAIQNRLAFWPRQFWKNSGQNWGLGHSSDGRSAQILKGLSQQRQVSFAVASRVDGCSSNWVERIRSVLRQGLVPLRELLFGDR